MRILRLKPGMRKELYREYLNSGHWKRRRADIIARANWRCEICGQAGPLEVHHLTYERLFEEHDSDLIALCPQCHEKQHGYKNEDDMIDLNSKKTGPLVLAHLDRAMLAARKAESPRRYLGASVIGDECQRKLQYEYFGTERDFPPEAKTLRIFARGNMGEALMDEWLARASFDVAFRQKGFSQLGGKLAGHVDGVIMAGPPDCGPYPRLWEHKTPGSKGWKKIEREGMKRASPVYYGQMQLYMAYLELDENPGLFTALNADTMEILALDIPFDQETAQSLSDKAVRIIRTCEAGEQLPRCAKDASWLACKMCDWRLRCWNEA